MQMLEEPINRFRDPFEELDVIYEVLRNRRRRTILRYLNEKRCVNLSDMARELAAVEHEKRVGQVEESEGKNMYIALYQVHIPRMEDAGILELDDDNDVKIKKEAHRFLQYMPSQAEWKSNTGSYEGAVSDVEG